MITIIAELLLLSTLTMSELTSSGPLSTDSCAPMPVDSFSDNSVDLVLNDTVIIEDEPILQKMPELVTFYPAEYPPSLSRTGIEGTVTLHLLINEKGHIDSCTVVKGVHPVLDTNAVVAGRKLFFSPGIADSVPVPVIIEFFYHFNLKDVFTADSVITFDGYLRERGTRRPVSDAAISVRYTDTIDTTLPVPCALYFEKIGSLRGQQYEQGAITTNSDSTGYFCFKGLPNGNCTTVISAPSMKIFHSREYLGLNKRLSVTWYMEPENEYEYEILVYGKDERREVSNIKIDRKQIQNAAGTSGDAVKVVSSLPGVARSNYIGGALALRGTGNDDSKTFIDGLPYYIPFHMATYKSSYNSDAIESVELCNGGVSARYGDLIGGALLLKARNGRSDRWGGYVDINMIDATLLAEGPLGKSFSILTSGRCSYIHKLFAYAYDKFGDKLPAQMTPEYRDFIFRISGTPQKNHSLYASTGLFHDALHLHYPNIRGGNQTYENKRDETNVEVGWMSSLLGWEWQLHEKLKNKLTIGINTEHDRNEIFGYIDWRDHEGGFFYRNECTYSSGNWYDAMAGVEGVMYNYTGNISLPQTDNSILKRNVKEKDRQIIPYLEFILRPTDMLQFTTGFRYNIWGIENHHGSMLPEFINYRGFDNTVAVSVDPCVRVSGKYTVNKKHLIKLAFGNFAQKPNWNKNNSFFGNPDLTTEKSSQCILGHQWQITDLISTDVQLYGTKMWDLTRTAGVTDSVPYIDNGKGRVRGLELLIRHEQGKHFFGWLAYTYSKSERWDFEMNRWIPFEFDQTHNLIAVANWTLARDITAGFRIQYTTGNPVSPVIGSIYNEQTHTYLQKTGTKNSGRMPPHFQFDCKVGKTFRMKTWLLSTYLEVFNASYPLYKSPQEYLYNYDPFDYRQQKPDRQIVSQVIIPSLGIRAEF